MSIKKQLPIQYFQRPIMFQIKINKNDNLK